MNAKFIKKFQYGISQIYCSNVYFPWAYEWTYIFHMLFVSSEIMYDFSWKYLSHSGNLRKHYIQNEIQHKS